MYLYLGKKKDLDMILAVILTFKKNAEIIYYGHKQVLSILPNQKFIYKGSNWSNLGQLESQKESMSP